VSDNVSKDLEGKGQFHGGISVCLGGISVHMKKISQKKYLPEMWRYFYFASYMVFQYYESPLKIVIIIHDVKK
jgi:hypothetical protein